MTKPVHATHHCRHYFYDRSQPDWLSHGPRCARGVDLSGPGASKKCWSEPDSFCDLRQEYTEEERTAWMQHRDASMVKLGKAISAIGSTVGMVAVGTEGAIACPNCQGRLEYSRARNGHVWIVCAGEDCIGPVHFNIDRSKTWPSLQEREVKGNA